MLNVKADFPVFRHSNVAYLDTAASSLTPQCVIDAMQTYYEKFPVNVHRGVYALGYQATEAYEAARDRVAQFINAPRNSVVFTKGASHALNIVAHGLGKTLNPGDEIIVSELEHHSNYLPWVEAAKLSGARIVFVPLNAAGEITVEAFQAVLSPKTQVVALTYVSNTMGTITPLSSLIPLAHEQGAVVVVDAAQAAAHKVIDVSALDVDFLAFSAHKMCGPTGIGVLYGKEAHLNALEPLEFGGEMNDYVSKESVSYKDAPYRFETGTPPIAEALGLAQAVHYLQTIGFEALEAHEKALRAYTLEALLKIPGVTIYNPDAPTGIIHFNLDGVHPHDAVSAFDEHDVAVRAGHHCAQLMMQWLNVPATLRASFYLYNDFEDCDRFIASVKAAQAFFAGVGF